MSEPFNFLGNLTDKEVSQKEKEYYSSHKDLKLTPTSYKTQYGRQVYEDQYGAKHSESSITVKDSKGRWMNVPTIFNGEYVNEKLARDIIEDNKYIDPENNKKIKTFETLKDAEEEAVKRNRSLNKSDQSWNEEDMMNQRQAGNILRRNAPKGEHPAFINQQEASWLKGMGGAGRPTKSGLRSYSWWGGDDDDSGNDPPSSVTGQSDASGGDGQGYNYNIGGSGELNVGGWLKERGINLDGDPNSNLHKQPEETAEQYHQRISGGDGGSGDGGSGGSGGVGGSGSSGGGMQTRNNTSSSISEIDKPTHEFRKKVYDKSGEIMDRPYEKYEGERFADPSVDTTTAQQSVRDMQGQGEQAYKDASGVGKDVSGYQAEQVQGGNFLQGQGVDQYMNPHTSNVIGGLQDQAMKSMQMGRNQLGAQAQMAGAGMGSRSAIEKGVMAGEVMSNLNQQTGKLLNQSFADASAQKRADMKMNQDAQRYNQQAGMQAQDVRLRGARGMTDATGAGRQAGYQDAQMLSKVGADIEGRDQREKDFEYDEYIEGRDWDKNNAMFASNVLSGAPVGTTTTQNNPQYRNKGGGRLGSALAGAGAGWLYGGPTGAVIGGGLGYLGNDMGGLV